MIKGIGTDIVSLERINQVRLKHIGFSKRILTPNEEKLYLKNSDLAFLAGRFAAKEAISKALGVGIGKLSWQNIEILPNAFGKPDVIFLGDLQDLMMKETRVHLSISHEKDYAVATAIWEAI
jgi:holo-[acyl-carrier-protein] synthase